MFAIGYFFYIVGIGFLLGMLSNILAVLKRGCYPSKKRLLTRAAGMAAVGFPSILIGWIFHLFE